MSQAAQMEVFSRFQYLNNKAEALSPASSSIYDFLIS